MVIYKAEGFLTHDFTDTIYVISIVRFDGHLMDGYPSTYGHM